MPDRFAVERAVRDSDLQPPARLIMLTLATSADQATSVIPARYTPSLTRIEAWTGLGRSTIARHLNELETSGWLQRRRPSVQDARSKKARTEYRLLIPSSARAGLVEQSASPSPGLELVPERDISSARAALVSNKQTSSNQRAILSVIRDALIENTGKSYDDAWCAKVRDHISDHPKPGSYYAAAIRSNPQRYVPTPMPRYSGEIDR